MSDMPSIEELAGAVVDFCSPAERSHWDLLDKFWQLTNRQLLEVLRHAMDHKKLIRHQEADGWRYRAAFPGVDIDRIHRVKAHA